MWPEKGIFTTVYRSHYLELDTLSMNTEFTTPFGVFHLHRFPSTRNGSLQAWDAADEYLLHHVFANFEKDLINSVCIINDDFGALSCALAKNDCVLVTDSLMSKTAIEKNLKRNQLENSLKIIDPFEFQSPAPPYSLVMIKVPKTLALLEDLLISLQEKLTPESAVIAAGKVSLVTKSVLSLFETYIGPTTTSLAKKKSRLIFARPSNKKGASRPAPITVKDNALDFTLINHVNVFCRDHLDIGARFLLEHLPLNTLSQKGLRTAVDLGCGNGVLGISFLRRSVESEVYFVDESSSAIQSARATSKAAGVDDRSYFIQSHALASLPEELKGNVDVILCNPPFHQNNAITEEIAWQMFKDAKHFLSTTGVLVIVANRQLNYMIKLKKLFSDVAIIARNKKFSIYRASKR
ncbi:MAG: methyltransferase [Pseudomonadota bacterium]